ncbi:Helix-turn-helix domain-containing protein [Marinitoga hydrogenitolerans DSM 16785]|uniref:Helix-turn-helix domain-containing protein n=1 Tax=Marinitoga hydrogenitolerans (strain DSM 16785 / JCM 12826 / AT1271) TaxID=1122195 RepID=A0A1M4WP58_MARH1|nr:diguanylate cyclase [Marinitoga hydrogenitolerans]SHE83016.1 Helix-turn-helix domain-containing protein [Marinitoga hydrogenitolerans DSM 16785]
MENYILKSINSALKFIEENISNDFSLEDIAEYSNFSLSYLYKLFNLIVGMSIKEYIRKRRLSKSVYDLFNSNMNILEIAIKYQYNTYESYSRAFKKEFGLCPSEVRKKKINVPLFKPITLNGGDIIMENRNYLLLIDIDKFADINKTYGRKFGDLVLSQIPERIKEVLNKENFDYENKKAENIERLGGDEFVIVLKNADEKNAKYISKKILENIKKPFAYENIQVTASIGITEYVLLNKDTYDDAYKAMINAKKEGRNTFKLI